MRKYLVRNGSVQYEQNGILIFRSKTYPTDISVDKIFWLADQEFAKYILESIKVDPDRLQISRNTSGLFVGYFDGWSLESSTTEEKAREESLIMLELMAKDDDDDEEE